MHQNESDDAVACHFGTRVRKNHTSKRSAFQTVGSEPAFVVYEDKILKIQKRISLMKMTIIQELILIQKLHLVKYHPGFDSEVIESLIKLQYRAIIFEGTGLGHVGKNNV